MSNSPIAHTPRRLRASLALSAAVVVAALGGAASASATTVPTSAPHTTTVQPAPGATTQGIIMRDGGICDPIRHMGC
jgi:hypothetical protein